MPFYAYNMTLIALTRLQKKKKKHFKNMNKLDILFDMLLYFQKIQNHFRIFSS